MHLTWSDETSDGKCARCDEETILVIAGGNWDADDLVDQDENFPDGIEIDAEVTGHYCAECNRLVSLSLNQ